MTVSKVALAVAMIVTGAAMVGAGDASARDIGSGRGDRRAKVYECVDTALVFDYVLGARCTARGGAPEQGVAYGVRVTDAERAFDCDSAIAGDVNVKREGKVKTLTGYRCRETEEFAPE
ncbi:hypothetical protein [Nocardia pseudobrasiliensis]|uniref:Subtilisin inhibitor-like n=1 Tax=Nocardia pseudobrasiliensis TaxID=45979 RepID=A0A370I2G0_9NOCA|nr:hypothetical protein [Nocardia pseudobrasiliensis]RDI64361.1 hypothetical protein DFR76_108193 [Nocardia pseudobrasiliensis]